MSVDIQADALAIQQAIATQFPNGVGIGEVFYMMVGETTYEVTGPTKDGDDTTITQVTSGISLEQLASISSEQESIKSNYDEGYAIVGEEADTETTGSLQEIMETGDQIQVSETTKLSGLEGTTFKLGDQDLFLPSGQQLPLEIQEMVAKGLPVDLSNYELIIEGGDDNVNVVDPKQIGGAAAAEAEPQSKNGIFVQVVTACPGEFDDGEFRFLVADEDAVADEHEIREIPNTGYLNNYLAFARGGKLQNSVPNQMGSARGVVSAKSSIVGVGRGGAISATTSMASRGVSTGAASARNLLNEQALKRKRTMDDVADDKFDKIARNDYDADWKPASSTRGGSSSGMRGKTRGRGRGAANYPSVAPRGQAAVTEAVKPQETTVQFPVNYVMQNEPHNCQKGDFVVDRKDLYKLPEFAIWRIEHGKLLQKFDAVHDVEGRLLHKSASVYSSWSGDIRTNFKAVMADVLSTSLAVVGRKPEIIVKLQDKFMPKPIDEVLEQNQLMQLFNIYVHVLLNQSLEPQYISAIHQQNEMFYLEPLTQLDHLLVEAKNALLGDITFIPSFKKMVESYSCYSFSIYRGEKGHSCQATGDGSPGYKTVKFYGQVYDRENLNVLQEVLLVNSQDCVVGMAAYELLGVYHSMHHFKYLLFKKCQEEVIYLANSPHRQSDDIPEIMLQNRVWVQQMFSDFKGLLDRYIIIQTESVEPTDETNMLQSEDNAQQFIA